MVNYIRASFENARENFREKFNGFLYGVVVGESLGEAFKQVPIGGELQNKGQKVEFIDRLYSEVGFRNLWSPETYLVLETCGLLMDVYNGEGSLKDILLSKRVTEFFRKAPSHDAFRHLGLREGCGEASPVEMNMLFKVAPIGVMAGRCRLTEEAAIKVTLKIVELTEKDPLVVFPALELVLTLMSIFLGNSSIPDPLGQIDAWVTSNNLKTAFAFELYKAKRSMPLEELDPESCLWTWKYLSESIIGLYGEDFVVVETARELIALSCRSDYDGDPYAIETGVEWLKCEYADAKTRVWYEGGK